MTVRQSRRRSAKIADTPINQPRDAILRPGRGKGRHRAAPPCVIVRGG